MTSIATILNENPLHAKIFKISAKISSHTNTPSYVVGGYVRDALLSRETNDIDISPGESEKLEISPMTTPMKEDWKKI